MFSKIYKLWIEIEECVPEMGEFRDLSSEGKASPVPLAEFEDLDAAVDYAETFASDRTHPRLAQPVGRRTGSRPYPVD